MPNISLSLTSVDQSVTRPIIFDIISQVQNITRYSPSTKIYFPGDTQKMLTPGSAIDQTDRNAVFNTAHYNFIEVDEEYDVNTIGSTATTQREQNCVFVDQYLDVYLKPIYATANITINFKYRSPSKTDCLRWRDDIRVRCSQMRDTNLHSITYHYLLNPEILHVLEAIYANREAYLGYYETIKDYIVNHSTTRLGIVSDVAGTVARLAISETQMRIVGLFNWDGMPDKPERDDTTGTWTTSFSYRFTYEKPIACNLKYPVIVHNQLLPKKLIDWVNTSYDLTKRDKQYTHSLGALAHFEVDTFFDQQPYTEGYIRLPYFDDWVMPRPPNGTGTLFCALCEVDTSDKKTLLNLNELGDYVIDRDVMQFIMESELPYITKLFKSIIQVFLYRNDSLVDLRSIVATSKGEIASVSGLDLRLQFRVRFALVTDMTLLDPDALRRLRLYPKALVKLLGSISELLAANPDFNNLGDKHYISDLDFSIMYRILTGYDERGTAIGEFETSGNLPSDYRPSVGNRWGNDGGYGMGDGLWGIPISVIQNYLNNHIGVFTVETTGVIARRMEELDKDVNFDYGQPT